MREGTGLVNSFTDGLLGSLMVQAEAAIPTEAGDYEQDGLLHCGKCHTRKQVSIRVCGKDITVKCLCQCGTEERNSAEAEEKRKQREEHIKRLKSQGIQDKAVQGWTFENDDGRNPIMRDRAKRYLASWKKIRAENIGVLLWGSVGTGKTYFAACIANALIDKGIPVLMTNFPKIINALSGFCTEDKNAYVESLSQYDLLVIDDLGAERQSEYGHEIVFSVIDSRYKSEKPTIITTNMTLDELKGPKDAACNRIYDRILEMCTPIRFEGESWRAIERKSKAAIAKEIFEGDDEL